jgi:exonuclease III
LINTYNDTDGRLILINVEINNTIFTLVCIYAPNCRSSRKSFFKEVSDKIQEYGIGIPIVGGDFSETLKAIDRKTLRSNQNNHPVSSFKNLIKLNKLVDIWRYLNENIQQYTWSRKDRSQASKIDLILIGTDFAGSGIL